MLTIWPSFFCGPEPVGIIRALEGDPVGGRGGVPLAMGNGLVQEDNHRMTIRRQINTTFDFRLDTPLGKDADTRSPTLREFHMTFWSKSR